VCVCVRACMHVPASGCGAGVCCHWRGCVCVRACMCQPAAAVLKCVATGRGVARVAQQPSGAPPHPNRARAPWCRSTTSLTRTRCPLLLSAACPTCSWCTTRTCARCTTSTGGCQAGAQTGRSVLCDENWRVAGRSTDRQKQRETCSWLTTLVGAGHEILGSGASAMLELTACALGPQPTVSPARVCVRDSMCFALPTLNVWPLFPWLHLRQTPIPSLPPSLQLAAIFAPEAEHATPLLHTGHLPGEGGGVMEWG